MSDDRKSGGFGDKGGFGPKKPKATFGDVMLGIPAGRGGEKEERGGRGGGDRGRGKGGGGRTDRPPDRRNEGRRGDRPASPAQAAGSEAAGAKPEGAKHERRDHRKGREHGNRGGER